MRQEEEGEAARQVVKLLCVKGGGGGPAHPVDGEGEPGQPDHRAAPHLQQHTKHGWVLCKHPKVAITKTSMKIVTSALTKSLFVH